MVQRMTTPLDVEEFKRRRNDIEFELRDVIAQRVAGNVQSISTALKDVFEKLFGDKRQARERVQFLVYVAPLMRRLTIDLGRQGHASGTINLNAMELDQWLARLEGFDPECALMIDLRYFAGLSTRETAAALGLSPQVVIRDLRFAKAWLQARVRWAGNPQPKSSE
ncbi:MAG TPA: ECF-type sigma factor [Steroidobacteraceae bacterium]|nr:ECF-type sigma factor [Steroidobacteraceae bacterium]